MRVVGQPGARCLVTSIHALGLSVSGATLREHEGLRNKPIPVIQTPPIPEFDPRWTIKDGNLEVVRTPGMTDEEGRAIAIEALKTVMGK